MTGPCDGVVYYTECGVKKGVSSAPRRGALGTDAKL